MRRVAVNPFLEYSWNGASIGVIMGIFLWREMKCAKRCVKLYDQKHHRRQEPESKCVNSPFVKQANAEFTERRLAPPAQSLVDKD